MDEMATRQKSDSARRLIAARQRAGFANARQAAVHFGWPYEAYILHERGSRSMKWEVGQKYADAYGVKLTWLMGAGEADSPPVSASPLGVQASAAPVEAAAKLAASGILPTSIESTLSALKRIDRGLLQASARKGVEYALVRTGAALHEDEIARLAEFAVQRIVAERAERLVGDLELTPLRNRAANDKE